MVSSPPHPLRRRVSLAVRSAGAPGRPRGAPPPPPDRPWRMARISPKTGRQTVTFGAERSRSSRCILPRPTPARPECGTAPGPRALTAATPVSVPFARGRPGTPVASSRWAVRSMILLPTSASSVCLSVSALVQDPTSFPCSCSRLRCHFEPCGVSSTIAPNASTSRRRRSAVA